jgi:hypothetical protein
MPSSDDTGVSPWTVAAGAALGALAVYALARTKNPYALLGGAWVGGVAPLAYAAFQTSNTSQLVVRST